MEIVETTTIYPNLRAEMARLGVKQKEIAEALDKKVEWVDARLRGKAVLSILDAIKIRNTFFKNMSFEYLFNDSVILPVKILE